MAAFLTDIRRFTEIDSTNRYLLDEARAGAPEGVVAVAEFQTQGRGRLARTWVAPPGASLLVSILFRPPLSAAAAHLVTMTCALAAADTVASVAGVPATLKWPNDLLAGDRKLAGLLAEALIVDGHLDALVVGMGLNVNWDEFPPELAGTATACNRESGHAVDRDALLARWLHEVGDRYDAMLGKGGTDVILDEYRPRCSTLGQQVRVEQSRGSFTGTAIDVDDAGRLLVEDAAGDRHVVAVGDVVHVRRASEEVTTSE